MDLQDFQNYSKGIHHIKMTAYNDETYRETIFFYDGDNLKMFNLENIIDFIDEMEKELTTAYPGKNVYFKINAFDEGE